jgi:uncharacterized membrane protein
MDGGTVLKLYGLMAVAFFAVDLVWLGVVASRFYRNALGHFLRDTPIWPAALAFYALYIAGILVFAVLPGLEVESLPRTVLLAAFFGLVAYATFDLTSVALFRDFPWRVVAVDLTWGCALTTIVAASGYGFGRWLGV